MGTNPMIVASTGNLIEAEAEALVNSVNCEGYMGKGIALQFKKAFPDNFTAYEKACRAKEVRPGRMFVFATGRMIGPKHIINFPTKREWRTKSRMEDIDAGLKALVEEVRRLNISSIAVPPLGCGLGGLDWRQVRPRIENAFTALPNVRVLLFEPEGAPAAKDMPVGTRRPELTIARALLIRLIRQYLELAYRLTLLEIQKLAYFLQESGENLRLNYVKHLYGPYAHNLNKVIEVLEGHFIRGYGDTQAPDVEIELLPEAAQEADRFLAGHDESVARLRRVSGLIDRFETPYGLELLSTVHWVATKEEHPISDPAEAVEAVLSWGDRKRRLFKPRHVEIAWNRLGELGWLPAANESRK